MTETMKLFLCLCVLALPGFCLLKETDGQADDDLSTHFVFPKDRGGRPTTRIIGGVEVTPHSYPFQVALTVVYSSTTAYFCGGSLISPQYVLTAAHCVEKNPRFALVQLGAHNVSYVEPTSIVMNSTKFVVHENWNRALLQNDVALVKLPRNVTFNQYIKAVPIARGSNTYESETGTIIGWGETDSGNQSAVLRRVNTNIMTNEACGVVDQMFNQTIIPTHICASGLGIVGSCSGDSGGPLLVDGVQVGIVSFGNEVCTLGKPSVFTRVTSFHDWIERHAVDGSDGNTSYRNVPYFVTLVFILIRLLN